MRYFLNITIIGIILLSFSSCFHQKFHQEVKRQFGTIYDWDEYEENETAISSGGNWIYTQIDQNTYKYRQFYKKRLIEVQHTNINEKGDTILKIDRWFDDGSLWISGTEKNGLKIGEWWTCEKNKCIKTNYKLGKKDGKVFHYNEDSLVIANINYIDGKREGNFVTYDSIGIELCKGKFLSLIHI